MWHITQYTNILPRVTQRYSSLYVKPPMLSCMYQMWHMIIYPAICMMTVYKILISPSATHQEPCYEVLSTSMKTPHTDMRPSSGQIAKRVGTSSGGLLWSCWAWRLIHAELKTWNQWNWLYIQRNIIKNNCYNFYRITWIQFDNHMKIFR